MPRPAIDPIQSRQLNRLRLISVGVLVCLIALYASSLFMWREARHLRYVAMGSLTFHSRYFRFIHGSGGWAFEWHSSRRPLPAGYPVQEEWQFNSTSSDPVQWLPEWRYFTGIPTRLFIPLWPLPLMWLVACRLWLIRVRRKILIG